MKAHVVDTNIVSYILKKDSRASLYEPLLSGSDNFVSFMTIGELNYWVHKRGWGIRRTTEMEELLRSNFIVHHSCESLMDWFARLRIQTEKAGRPISVGDALIAATALDLGCPLVTHNPKDFDGVRNLEILTATEN